MFGGSRRPWVLAIPNCAAMLLFRDAAWLSGKVCRENCYNRAVILARTCRFRYGIARDSGSAVYPRDICQRCVITRSVTLGCDFSGGECQCILPAANIDGDSIALPRGSRGVQPVCSRKLHDAAFQAGECHFVMLLGWHLALPRRVGDLSDGRLSTQATLAKGHSFGAVAIKE